MRDRLSVWAWPLRVWVWLESWRIGKGRIQAEQPGLSTVDKGSGVPGSGPGPGGKNQMGESKNLWVDLQVFMR